MARERPEFHPDPREIANAGAEALREIEERSKEETEALMSAVLCAAWPTLLAQNQ
jgi:hypothetical protein